VFSNAEWELDSFVDILSRVALMEALHPLATDDKAGSFAFKRSRSVSLDKGTSVTFWGTTLRGDIGICSLSSNGSQVPGFLLDLDLTSWSRGETIAFNTFTLLQ